MLLKKSISQSFLLLFIISSFIACKKTQTSISNNLENWEKRKIDISKKEKELEFGKSYLSIYSQIYSISEHKTQNLTVMVSLRNVSDTDTIYIEKASYYDTHGNEIHNYFNYPIFLAPLETTEIIIDETDTTGDTGSNFIFEWKIPKNCPEPLFEGVMNSMRGQQGLSFITQGVRIK